MKTSVKELQELTQKQFAKEGVNRGLELMEDEKNEKNNNLSVMNNELLHVDSVTPAHVERVPLKRVPCRAELTL